jgi:cysteine synthase A
MPQKTHSSKRPAAPQARKTVKKVDSTTQPHNRGSVLDAIGNTPLIQLEGVWVKLEYLNPSGSIKARIAKYMIEKAEKEGKLKPGDTIVEATSGNTGNALSMVAAVKGYKMIVVMPGGMSSERTAISKSFGAEILEVGDFHVNGALERAKDMGTQDGFFCPQQFDNEWNVEENRSWLGPEILSQLPKGTAPDAFVMGVGTGGTLVGVGQAFKKANPDVKIVGMEPNESCTLACGEIGKHLIEGIADGFVPGIFGRHASEIDEILAVPSEDAVAECQRLASEHGLLVGASSGANMLAAKKLLERKDCKTVVTILCDEGEKYLSKFYPAA